MDLKVSVGRRFIGEAVLRRSSKSRRISHVYLMYSCSWTKSESYLYTTIRIFIPCQAHALPLVIAHWPVSWIIRYAVGSWGTGTSDFWCQWQFSTWLPWSSSSWPCSMRKLVAINSTPLTPMHSSLLHISLRMVSLWSGKIQWNIAPTFVIPIYHNADYWY